MVASLRVRGIVDRTLNKLFKQSRKEMDATGRVQADLAKSQIKAGGVAAKSVRRGLVQQSKYTRAVRDSKTAVSGWAKEQRRTNTALGKTVRQIEKARLGMKRLNKERAKGGGGDAGAGLDDLAGGAASAGLARSTLLKAISYESAIADVKKVVDFDTSEELAKLKSDILKLSAHDIPVAAEGLAQIVASAGQAGIKEDLLGFTKDAAMVGVAFDIAADHAGDAMAGLRNIFGQTQADTMLIADSVNHLSNNVAATAPDLLNVLNRTGSTGKLIGLNAQEISALGATFLATKTPVEVAGTAMNAFFTKLGTAEQQGAKFQGALDNIGFSAEELTDMIDDDAQGAINALLEALKNSDDLRGNLFELFGQEYVDDAAKLVGALDIYKQTQELISNPNGYRGSAQKEFESRKDTRENDLNMASNSISRLATVIGDEFLPAVEAVSKAFSSAVNTVSDAIEGSTVMATGAAGLGLAASFVGGRAAFGFARRSLFGGKGGGGIGGALARSTGPTPVYVTNLGALGGMGLDGPGGRRRGSKGGRFGRLGGRFGAVANTASNLFGSVAGSRGGSVLRTGGKLLGKAAVPLMVGMSALDVYDGVKEGNGEKIGGGVGGLGGALGGAAAGAAVGSVVPVIGTAIGGIIGGIIGGFGGEWLGETLGGWLDDDDEPKKPDTQQPTTKQNTFQITIHQQPGQNAQDIVNELQAQTSALNDGIF